MEPSERRILVVTCFGHFMSHFNMLAFPILVLPLSAYMGLPRAEVLELSFWMYLLFGVSAIGWGLLADRFGAKALMMLYFFGAGLCAVWAAFSMDNPTMFSVALAGVGLFSAIYHPAGLGLIARGIKRISLGMAYNGIFGNLGLAGGPLVMGLVNWISGPVAAYVTLGAMNLAGCVMMSLQRVDEPAKDASAPANGNKNGMVGPFVILLFAMMMAGFTYRGTSVTLPAYFELNTPDIMQYLGSLWSGDVSSNLVATVLTSGIFLLGAFGQFAGGWFGDRHSSRWGLLIFHGITLPFVFSLAFVSNLPLVLVAFIYLFFLLGMQPMENTIVAKLSPPAFKHSAYGAKFVLTFGIGSLSVRMAGLVDRNWGIDSVFLVLGCITVVLVCVVGFLVYRTRGLEV